MPSAIKPSDMSPFSAHGRLRLHANRRFLEFSDGTPFFYLGDTAWELFHRLTFEESARYLANRAAKGFTVIQAVALAELTGIETPNANGDLPLGNQDPTRPLEPYFAHVDKVVAEAGRLGLMIGMLPTWGRYWKQDSDKKANPGIFTPDNARVYGAWLGNRYRDASLIWILGGDRNIADTYEMEIIESLAGGLREGDGGAHLVTFHPCGPGQSSAMVHAKPWLDFNMNQSSHAAHDHDNGLFIERDLAREPLKPTLDGEPRYECIPVGFYNADVNRVDRCDDYDARQAAWWAVLAGACGHTYGNNNIWQMYDTGRASIIWADTPWHQAIDHAGAFQMGHLARFVCSRPFTLLRPSAGILLDAPRSGGGKVRAALAQDGSFAVVYSPRGEQFTLDLDLLKPGRIRSSWFDPRYGTSHPFHTFDTHAIQTYVPPTRGRGRDWVLAVDSVDAVVQS